jgi:hypothetical protein
MVCPSNWERSWTVWELRGTLVIVVVHVTAPVPGREVVRVIVALPVIVVMDLGVVGRLSTAGTRFSHASHRLLQ